MIASTNYYNSPDIISFSTLTDHHIGMHKYNSNCTSLTNWFDLARTPCSLSERKPWNAFDSIEAILAATFKEEPLEAHFFEQSDVPSPWNTYWTDAAREGAGLDINDPVFGQHGTKYSGLCLGLFTNCDPNEPCDCEGHNCVGAQSTVGHTAAAATTAKSLGIPQIVLVPPSPTPSKSTRIVGTGRLAWFAAMSGSTEPRAALVSIGDQGTIMAQLQIQKDAVGTEQLKKPFAKTQEMLMRVAQYAQRIRKVQMVCVHAQQIIDLQRQIADLQTKQFLPPHCDNTELQQHIQPLMNERDRDRRRPAAAGTDEELWEELDEITRDVQQCWEVGSSLGTQLMWAPGLISRVGSGYNSTRNRTVATGLTTRTTRTIGNGPVLPPKTRHFKFTILPPIKYLSSDCIMTWSVRTLCSFNRSFTSRCHICDRTNIHWVAIENPPISRKITRYFTAIQRILVRSQIWLWEVKERLEMHNVRTDHVMIRSELKYLIGVKGGGTVKVEPRSGYNPVKKLRVYVWSG